MKEKTEIVHEFLRCLLHRGSKAPGLQQQCIKNKNTSENKNTSHQQPHAKINGTMIHCYFPLSYLDCNDDKRPSCSNCRESFQNPRGKDQQVFTKVTTARSRGATKPRGVRGSRKEHTWRNSSRLEKCFQTCSQKLQKTTTQKTPKKNALPFFLRRNLYQRISTQKIFQ